MDPLRKLGFKVVSYKTRLDYHMNEVRTLGSKLSYDSTRKLCWLKIEIPVTNNCCVDFSILYIHLDVWSAQSMNVICRLVHKISEKGKLLRKKKQIEKKLSMIEFCGAQNLAVIYMLCLYPSLQIERFIFFCVRCLLQIHRKGLSQQQFPSLHSQPPPALIKYSKYNALCVASRSSKPFCFLRPFNSREMLIRLD